MLSERGAEGPQQAAEGEGLRPRDAPAGSSGRTKTERRSSSRSNLHPEIQSHILSESMSSRPAWPSCCLSAPSLGWGRSVSRGTADCLGLTRTPLLPGMFLDTSGWGDENIPLRAKPSFLSPRKVGPASCQEIRVQGMKVPQEGEQWYRGHLEPRREVEAQQLSGCLFFFLFFFPLFLYFFLFPSFCTVNL